MRIFFYGNKSPCLELDGHKYDDITIVNNTKPLFLYLYIACVRKQHSFGWVLLKHSL